MEIPYIYDGVGNNVHAGRSIQVHNKHEHIRTVFGNCNRSAPVNHKRNRTRTLESGQPGKNRV